MHNVPWTDALGTQSPANTLAYPTHLGWNGTMHSHKAVPQHLTPGGQPSAQAHMAMEGEGQDPQPTKQYCGGLHSCNPHCQSQGPVVMGAQLILHKEGRSGDCPDMAGHLLPGRETPLPCLLKEGVG